MEGAAVLSGNGTNMPTGMINTTPVTTSDEASPKRAPAAYQYILGGDNSPARGRRRHAHRSRLHAQFRVSLGRGICDEQHNCWPGPQAQGLDQRLSVAVLAPGRPAVHLAR